MVGCFGTFLIGYWFSRLLSDTKRLKHLTFNGEWWEFLYADDSVICLPLQIIWPEACVHLMFIIVASPLSWRKTIIGCRPEWIGFVVNGIDFKCDIPKDRATDISITCVIQSGSMRD